MIARRWDREKFSRALSDLAAGFASYDVWLLLAWLEIRQRYRRSILGPFWLTISTGVLVGALGPLYGMLFGLSFSDYLPHLAIGFVLWQFMSSAINDSCYALIHAEGLIKQSRLPLSVHVFRVVGKNLIIFAHSAVIILVVVLAYPPASGWGLASALLGLVMLALTAAWLGLVAGIMCARFRDIPQIVQSLVQVAFFATPVLWKAENLGHHRWVAELNPLHHFLDVVRGPLLGEPVSGVSWIVVGVSTAAGCALAVVMFAALRTRIAYWV